MTTRRKDGAYEIRGEEDAIWLREEAMRQAEALGFAQREQWEIAIAVSELVMNAVRHAGGGQLWLTPIAGGLEAVVEDNGRGISDLKALAVPRNPFDPPPAGRRSLGAGVAALFRLMDEAFAEPGRELSGARVVVRKYLDKKRRR